MFEFPRSNSKNIFTFNSSTKKETPKEITYSFNIAEKDRDCKGLLSRECTVVTP